MKSRRWVCTNCGYSASERFTGDICPCCGLTFWKCSVCGYTLNSDHPPTNGCPECGGKKDFVNITSYIPDWWVPEYKDAPGL